jgi:NAD+ kinase
MKPYSFTIFTRQSKAKDSEIDFLCQGLLDLGFTLDDDNPELIIVVGGDGSLLKAIHEFNFNGLFLLINSGHLGFFSDYSIGELSNFMDDIVDSDPIIEDLPLLKININGEENYALNDLVIQAGRTCEFNLSINNIHFTSSRASGIVVGTAVSSTGYLASLNAPIVVSDPGIYMYSFIAPVFNRLFPNTISKAILSTNDVLSISASDPYEISLDGIPMNKDNECEVSILLSSTKEVKLLHLKEVSNINRIRKSISEIED